MKNNINYRLILKICNIISSCLFVASILLTGYLTPWAFFNSKLHIPEEIHFIEKILHEHLGFAIQDIPSVIWFGFFFLSMFFLFISKIITYYCEKDIFPEISQELDLTLTTEESSIFKKPYLIPFYAILIAVLVFIIVEWIFIHV